MLQPKLVEWFRALHRIPEPSLHEVRTNQYLRTVLAENGIDMLTPAENITIAVLQNPQPGPIVGLRCDTDALQITECTDLPYRSDTSGMMHACGHDAHMAAGLGAAILLRDRIQAWRGTVKIVFQPAEEGMGGALDVLRTGLVDDVDVFFGIHVHPGVPTGTFLCDAGPVCASADMFTLRIQGRGGHGAFPHLCHDTVTAGSAIVTALQHIASRFTDPLQPVVLTIGSFHAGTRCNIIAEEAVLEGTLRTFDPALREELVKQIQSIAEQTAAVHGCTTELDIRSMCSVTVNDPEVTEWARQAARVIAPEGPFAVQTRTMMGDDFSEYARIAPNCYAHIGIANPEKGTNFLLHTNRFAVDEDVLPLCAAWLAQFVVEAANRETGGRSLSHS